MPSDHYIRLQAEEEYKNHKAWARRAGRSLDDVPSVDEIFEHLLAASKEEEAVEEVAEELPIEEQDTEEAEVTFEDDEEDEGEDVEVPELAADVVAAIEAAETAEEVDALSEGDERKTVIAAAEKRRSELEEEVQDENDQ